MKTLAIIGSGALGQQIAHYAISDNLYSKIVFIDDFASEKEKHGYEIIGKTLDVLRLFKEGNFDELIIGIGYNHLSQRKKIYDLFKGNVPFGKVVHSSCWIDKTVEVQEGCFLYPNSTVDYHSVIKANTIVANNCMIAHNVVLESHSFISACVAVAGFSIIGEQCFIGISTTIIDNIEIIKHTQTGGGTVVITQIDKSGLYVGNPAKFIR